MTRKQRRTGGDYRYERRRQKHMKEAKGEEKKNQKKQKQEEFHERAKKKCHRIEKGKDEIMENTNRRRFATQDGYVRWKEKLNERKTLMKRHRTMHESRVFLYESEK